MRTSPRTRHLCAALAAVLVPCLLAAPSASAAEAPVAGAAAGVAPTESPAFIGLAGVDLRALGYRGPDIEAFDPAVVDGALPAGFADRGRDLGRRLDVLGPQRRGLAAIVPLLDAAVSAINPRVARQRTRIALASARVDLARSRLDESRASISRRRSALERHRERMAEVVVDAYVRPPESDAGMGNVDGTGTDVGQLATPVLRDAKMEHDIEVEDRLEIGLATAVATGVSRAQEVEALSVALTRAEQWLQHLESSRRALVAAKEEARARRQAVESRVQWLHDELDAMAHVLFRTQSGSPVWMRQLGDVPLREVEGIRVHVAVSHRLESLLAAARADGIVLGGWGHRSHGRQIELRRAHCGHTEEDVWTKPSGLCSPPTAIPGRSMHELGLAVDFTHDGESITSRRSPAYRWLAVHAPLYGFANLPSEPWHWSLTGR